MRGLECTVYKASACERYGGSHTQLLNSTDMLILHAAMAAALNLPTSALSAKTFFKGGVQHSEFRFEGTEAIRLGHSLETQVRSQHAPVQRCR